VVFSFPLPALGRKYWDGQPQHQCLMGSRCLGGRGSNLPINFIFFIMIGNKALVWKDEGF